MDRRAGEIVAADDRGGAGDVGPDGAALCRAVEPVSGGDDAGLESTSFFEKKEAKKLLLPGVVAIAGPSASFSGSFLLLFFKKEALAYLLQ